MINKERISNFLVDTLPIIIVISIIGIIITLIIYDIKNTNYEISYTTGNVVNKYEKEYDTVHYTHNNKGHVTGYWTTHHHEYYTVAKVKDVEALATLCHREYYEHHNIGDNVKIKVSQRYWKGKYKDTSYFIVY